MRAVVGQPPSGTVERVTVDGKQLTLKDGGSITNGIIDTAEFGRVRVDFRGISATMFLTVDQFKKIEKIR